MSISINAHLGLLGKHVHDRVTGFQGVVTSLTFDLYGCIQSLVHPGVQSDGKLGEQQWFDVSRLRVNDPTPVMDRPRYEWTPEAVAAGEKGPADKPAYNKA